jgi:hypothetical protein
MRIRLIIRKNRGDRRISITRKEILGKKRWIKGFLYWLLSHAFYLRSSAHYTTEAVVLLCILHKHHMYTWNKIYTKQPSSWFTKQAVFLAMCRLFLVTFQDVFWSDIVPWSGDKAAIQNWNNANHEGG